MRGGRRESTSMGSPPRPSLPSRRSVLLLFACSVLCPPSRLGGCNAQIEETARWQECLAAPEECKKLSLSGGNMVGTIPPAIGNLTALTYLELIGNGLTGAIPPEIGKLDGLTFLHLGGSLTGTIPSEIGQLEGLTYLELSANSLTGTIPAEIGNLTALTKLDLWGNDLTGTIPPEIGNLARLAYLDLDFNNLTGAIPPDIGNLTELIELRLSDNDLTGTIPPEIGNLTALTSLGLRAYDLTGTIPPEIGNLTELTYLELWGKDLTGTIPPEIGNLARLTYLGLYDNDLTGTIPPEISNLARLAQLVLRFNDLNGTIPPEIGKLKELTNIELNGNQLTGMIPASLGSLGKLEWLELLDNQLTGTMPAALGNLTKLRRLDVGNNTLTGAIPTSLGKLGKLEWLSLKDNNLSGTIPASIGDLTLLDGLDLRDNNLSGTLPSAIFEIPKLTYVYLKGNHFEGAIPVSVGRYTTTPNSPSGGISLGVYFPGGVSPGGGITHWEDIIGNASSLCYPRREYLDVLTDRDEPASADAAMTLRSIMNTFEPCPAKTPWPTFMLLVGLALMLFFSVTLFFQLHLSQLPHKHHIKWLAMSGLALGDVFSDLGFAGSVALESQLDNRLDVMYFAASLAFITVPMLLTVVVLLCDRIWSPQHWTGVFGRSNSARDKWMHSIMLLHALPDFEVIKFLPWTMPDEKEEGLVDPNRVTFGTFPSKRLQYCYWSTYVIEDAGQFVLQLAYVFTSQQEDRSTSIVAAAASLVSTLASLLVRFVYPVISVMIARMQRAKERKGRAKVVVGSVTSKGEKTGDSGKCFGSVRAKLYSCFACLCLVALSGSFIGVKDTGRLQSDEMGLVGDKHVTGDSGAMVWSRRALHQEVSDERTLDSVIRNLDGQTYLDLSNSSLTGTIPPEIGQLEGLTYLDLGGTGLTGTIPPEICNLTGLTGLDLGRNDLTGTIPPEINKLEGLTYLDLSLNGLIGGTGLTGTIPPEIGNLTGLTYLNLYRNDLTGAIPPEICNLTGLTGLDLGFNDLTGTIPPEIGNLTPLTYLDLSLNDLTGTIPAEIGNLTALTQLDLSYNGLAGTIPPEIGKLTALTELDLAGTGCCKWPTGLTGTIPAEIGKLTALTKLDLGGNDLTGTIPPEIGKLEGLTQLDLTSNNLTGEIPPSIAFMPKLEQMKINKRAGTSLCYNRIEALKVINERFKDVPALVNMNVLHLVSDFEPCPTGFPPAAYILIVGLAVLLAASSLFFVHLNFCGIPHEHHMALLAMNALALGDVWSDVAFLSTISEDRIYFALSVTCVAAPMAITVLALVTDRYLHGESWRGSFNAKMSVWTKLRHGLIVVVSLADFEMLKALNWKVEDGVEACEASNELEFDSLLMERASYATYFFEDVGQFFIQLAFVFTRQRDDEDGEIMAAATSLVLTFASLLSKVVFPAVMHWLGGGEGNGKEDQRDFEPCGSLTPSPRGPCLVELPDGLVQAPSPLS